MIEDKPQVDEELGPKDVLEEDLDQISGGLNPQPLPPSPPPSEHRKF